jgi:branched-chain amino acid transport system substrate-binding protein
MIRPIWICLLFLSLIPSAHAGDIVIGMSAAFTGPSRGLGIELYRGASAYFAEVNSRGGVHGRKIVLRAYDDGYNPSPALANTRKLIREDGAYLLFGYVGTPTTARVLPLLESHKKESVFLFAPFTGAELLREGPYSSRVFNFRASYREETAGLVDQFVKLGRKRIAVFYQIDAYGRSGWDGVRRALGRHGLKICAEATYRRGDPFAVSMKRPVEILAEGKPDAIVCVGAYAACAAFIRDARDAGLDVPIANLSFVGSENLLALLERAGEAAGRDYTADLINTQVVPSHNQTDLPGVRLYRELMAKHAPAPPPTDSDTYRPLAHSFTGLEGFLGARLLVALL